MRLRPALGAAVSAVALLAACTGPATSEPADDSAPVSVDPPAVGACRDLGPDALAAPSDDTEPVACSEPHTAETFLVGEFTGKASTADSDDPRLADQVYRRCERDLVEFLGGTDSLVMRSVLTWAWFRPTEEQWEAGARWYRCDVVVREEVDGSVELPETARGVLLGLPEDRWMVCAVGDTVADSEKVPCDQPHAWRAATTIVLGKAEDPYPGRRVVEVRTRDFCSDSVGAWLNYPVEYDYGYTWFHRAEWQAGNRRSICWAKTDQ